MFFVVVPDFLDHLRSTFAPNSAVAYDALFERVRNAGLQPLHREASALLARFARHELQHVRREFNTDADALVNAALDAAG